MIKILIVTIYNKEQQAQATLDPVQFRTAAEVKTFAPVLK
jgi:hypothetical protein